MAHSSIFLAIFYIKALLIWNNRTTLQVIDF